MTDSRDEEAIKLDPRDKAALEILNSYAEMSPEQQEKAAEMLQDLIQNDPNKEEKLQRSSHEPAPSAPSDEELLGRIEDPISDNHREAILNDPELSDEERERLQDISDQALDKMFSDPEQEQQAFVDQVAPQLVDILNDFDTDNYQGKHRTIAFDKEENTLSLTDNATGEAVMTAQWHPDEGEWENQGSSLTEEDRDQIRQAWELSGSQQQQDKKVELER